MRCHHADLRMEAWAAVEGGERNGNLVCFLVAMGEGCEVEPEGEKEEEEWGGAVSGVKLQ